MRTDFCEYLLYPKFPNDLLTLFAEPVNSMNNAAPMVDTVEMYQEAEIRMCPEREQR